MGEQTGLAVADCHSVLGIRRRIHAALALVGLGDEHRRLRGARKLSRELQSGTVLKKLVKILPARLIFDCYEDTYI